MAKKKAAAADKAATPPAAPKITKAQAIRDALKQYRNLMPKEIAEKLSATGLTVNANEVSIYKSQMKAKRLAKKAAKPERAATRWTDDICLGRVLNYGDYVAAVRAGYADLPFVRT